MKKVVSADAAFFVPKLLQEREQHQDGLNQAEHEHQPLEFVHDITPSLARGKPTHQTAKYTISQFIKISIKNSAAQGLCLGRFSL